MLMKSLLQTYQVERYALHLFPFINASYLGKFFGFGALAQLKVSYKFGLISLVIFFNALNSGRRQLV